MWAGKVAALSDMEQFPGVGRLFLEHQKGETRIGLHLVIFNQNIPGNYFALTAGKVVPKILGNLDHPKNLSHCSYFAK